MLTTSPGACGCGGKGGTPGATRAHLTAGPGGAGGPSYAVAVAGAATFTGHHATFAPSTGGKGAAGAPAGDSAEVHPF